MAEVIRRGGPSRPTIYRILNDPAYVPETYTLDRLAKILGVSLEWLALGEGPMILVGVREEAAPYQPSPMDPQLMGACVNMLIDELARHGASRPPASKLGAAINEIYLLCEREKKQPTPDLVAPFVRILMA